MITDATAGRHGFRHRVEIGDSTLTGAVLMGTLAYMARSRIDDVRHVTAAADQYSLGVVSTNCSRAMCRSSPTLTTCTP